MPPSVIAVSLSPTHSFSKQPRPTIHLLAGIGVEGDAHAGALVRHRYRVRQDPTQPNLCQVHLLASELLTELKASGFTLQPGQMGENITTAGIDLMQLPTDTLLTIGGATLKVTGMRNPCQQMNDCQPGLMSAPSPKLPPTKKSPAPES